MRKFLDIVMWIWQLPQNIVGLLLVAWFRPEFYIDFRTVRIYYSTEMRGGISLGHYVLLSDTYWEGRGDGELHEYGHSLQSRYLGPLYLPVIGLPSLIWALWWNEGRNRSYYSFYTEKWADHLGGVLRDE